MTIENDVKNEEHANTNHGYKNIKRILIILLSLIVVALRIFTVVFFIRKNKLKKTEKITYQFKNKGFYNKTLNPEDPPKYSGDTFEQCQEYINREIDKLEKISDFLQRRAVFSRLRTTLPLKPLEISHLSSLFLYTKTSPPQVLKRVIYDNVDGTYEDDIFNFFNRKSENIINIIKSTRTTRMVSSSINSLKKEKQTIMWMFFDLLDIEVDFLHVGKSEKIIRNIMRDSLKGLKCMHDHNYAHLDIKMDNIMGLTKSNGEIVYKLIDLGLTRHFPKKSEKFPDLILGTFPYFAPESLTKHIYGVKAYIWALGATAWFLSIRNTLFIKKDGTTDLLKYGKFINHGFNDLISSDNHRFVFRKETSPELRNFIMTSMELDWNKRPTADELLKHPFIENKKLINAPKDSYDIYDSSMN